MVSTVPHPAPGGPRHAAPTARVVDDSGYRPDIQGLRAIAVGLVIVYHLYPSRLPGGFNGVDVFFVISGFLITGHLARGLRRDGRVRLLDFWGRRARRLLPAAAVVLTVTWLASRWILPVTQLPAAADQVRASALYFQNWVLAGDSVDYLSRDDAPSPVQHFWSLSVEEQFYLVWPMLFVIAAGVMWAWRRRPGRTVAVSGRAVALGLACALFVASLSYSIVETAANPAAAYFVTPTRVWELALGGIIALLPNRVTAALGRIGLLAWVGLAAVIGTAVLLSTTASFPGWIALVPVGGAALLLACGSRQARFGPAWLTSSRPFVFVGDLSYSLYLWHWPVIVLWLAYTGGAIGRVDGPVVLLTSLALAWLTMKLVEDPVRRSALLRRRPAYSLATVATVLIPVLVVALTVPASAGKAGSSSIDARHPGGAALLGVATPNADFVPTLAQAPLDLSVTSANGCQGDTYDTDVTTCEFGDTVSPQRTVALVGDSHAGQWSNALDRIGKARHWKIVGVLHGSCTFGSTMTQLDDQPFTACQTWKTAALRELVTTIKPDTVIMSNRPNLGTPDNPEADATSWRQIGRGIADYTASLNAAGIATVAIRETPELDEDVPDCLAQRGGTVTSCSVSAKDAILADTPTDVAHARLGDALPLVDMNDLICSPRVCAPVVGNVVVYRDSHHLSRTYTLSIASYLGKRLAASDAFT